MSREFKIHRKYYEDGRQLYKKATITIHPGVTILIGCNGSGKTTLQQAISDDLKSKNIPVLRYDNLSHRDNSLGELLYNADYESASQLMCDSEGEAITDNLTRYVSKLMYFMKHGREELSRFARIFQDEEPEDSKYTERWLLFDAVDSGLSIDQVQDLKTYFLAPLKKQCKTDDLYIILTANEYEMCRGERCFNVSESKYVEIDSYDDYSEQIIKSRDYKDKMRKKWLESMRKDEEET